MEETEIKKEPIPADEAQIPEFKINFCEGAEARKKLAERFEIRMLQFEEMPPGKCVRSYASGSKAIYGSYMIFEAKDSEYIYYPVFSETVGRELAKLCNCAIQPKMTMFRSGSSKSTTVKTNKTTNNTGQVERKPDNAQLLNLIVIARNMMVFHVMDPKPMYGPLAKIYHKLEEHPRFSVFADEIHTVNKMIGIHLKKLNEKPNAEYHSLNEFIAFIDKISPDRELKNFDFEEIRKIIKKDEKYANEELFF